MVYATFITVMDRWASNPHRSSTIFPTIALLFWRLKGFLSCGVLEWTGLCSKARKLIGLIYCRFYQHSSPKSLLQMYLTLVRPHLDYASQVWNTSKIGEIDSFEKVQKFTLRVYSKQWNSGYDELLQLFSLPTLQQCRLYLHLSIMWIVYSLSYFPSGMFVKQTWRVTRSQFYQLYVCPYTHININQYCNSFVPRIIRNWN